MSPHVIYNLGSFAVQSIVLLACFYDNDLKIDRKKLANQSPESMPQLNHVMIRHVLIIPAGRKCAASIVMR